MGRITIFFIAIIVVFSSLDTQAQAQSVALKGRVVDAIDGDGVIGAVVRAIKRGAGDTKQEAGSVATSNSGEFELRLAKGSYTLECSHISYNTLNYEIEVEGDATIECAMNSEGKQIDRIVVSTNSPLERVASVQIGVERIEIEQMMRSPSLFGQRDIIRALTLLPGVKAESDASSGFQVRGGNSSQNLVLFDNMPIYNAGHLLGIFSIFNDNVLSYASLYKGLMGAEFSGGSSSVLDIGGKSGSKESYSASVDIGLLLSSLYVEGPIVKDKLSFSIGARCSYIDLFLAMMEEYRGNSFYFYDVNAKIDYNVNDNNNLSVSYFRGEDCLGLEDMMSMGWGNQSSALQWFHRYSDRFSHRTSLTLSQYSSANEFSVLDMENSMLGGINNYGVKQNFDLQVGERHALKFGLQLSYIDLTSADWSTSQTHLRERSSGVEGGIWLSDQWSASDRFTLSAGLRLGLFTPISYRLIESEATDELVEVNSLSEAMSESYIGVEPRLTMNYRLTERQSLKLGYSRTTQNIQSIRSSSMSLPFDRMLMSTNTIEPQVADQVSLGYIALTSNDTYELTIEGYYKEVDNVYDYRDGMNFTSDIVMEDIILGGEGRSYGLEVTLKRNIGKLTGWIGYTLSWSENRIEGIDGGNWYASSNDRRHDISVVGIYEINDRWSLSSSWVFNTGQALTAPSAKYTIMGETYYYYAERNGYRAPNYHRLDISATRTKIHRSMTSELSFGCYNLYDRENPFMISFESDDSSASGTKAVQTALFGIIPSISYGLRF